MSLLNKADQALGRMLETATSKVLFSFRGKKGFDAQSFPRSVVAQVRGRVTVVGQRTLCPHRIQLFVPAKIDRQLGGLADALKQEVEAAVTRWVDREEHEVLGPVRVEWLVDEFTDEDEVVVNISFGAGTPSSLELDRGPAGAPSSVLELDEGGTEDEIDTAPAVDVWGRLIGDDGVVLELAGEAVVGRTDKADLLAPDPTISGRHARFTRQEAGRCFVQDLTSANGTWIDGQRLDRIARLRHGDRVELGDLGFRFEEAGGA